MFDERDSPSRSTMLPSGCVLIASLVVIALAIAGYFGYRHLTAALDVPAELEPYTEADSVRAQIVSKAPRPPEGTRLDSAWLALYTDGLDSTGSALLETRDVIDSLFRTARVKGDTVASLLTSPGFYRAVSIVAPATKRALVAYLNDRGRSFDEYFWAKERTLAATDITLESADSTLQTMVGSFFRTRGAKISFGSGRIRDWFETIDSLRASGAITGSERMLAATARRRILERGLASLYGFDTDFAE